MRTSGDIVAPRLRSQSFNSSASHDIEMSILAVHPPLPESAFNGKRFALMTDLARTVSLGKFVLPGLQQSRSDGPTDH